MEYKGKDRCNFTEPLSGTLGKWCCQLSRKYSGIFTSGNHTKCDGSPAKQKTCPFWNKTNNFK